MSFSCTDKETLIAYLYGECDATTRGTVEAHLAACPACADEVGGFGAVRETLSEWTPPARVGGFRLVRDGEAEAPAPGKVLRPARWWQAPLPALAKVAAAILLFAGGAALANLDVRYDQNGFALRTGWTGAAPSGPQMAKSQAPGDQAKTPAAETAVTPAIPAVATGPGASDASPWRVELASLERQLREEFRQQLVAARGTGPGAHTAQVDTERGFDENSVMARVHALLEDSERRQEVQMAYRLSQVASDFQAQRKADLLRVQQTFGQLDGPPTLQPSRQKVNYFFPVSLKK
jgi:anti-sigma factor RsiW